MAGQTKTEGFLGVLQAVAIGRHPQQTFKRLVFLVIFAVILIGFFSFVFLPIRVTGPSMYPTYRNGQINFINRLAYLRHEPQRGDVVGIRFAGKRVMYLKRIVGMPNEEVHFSEGGFYINGKLLEEPYLTYVNPDWDSPPKHLGTNEYYVVGDNRSMSFENHEKGATERERIMGKIIMPPSGLD